ncbi:TATA-box binding protein [ANMV-1 virus]|nr:TATA-box binding protein [ANMV-1 virus]
MAPVERPVVNITNIVTRSRIRSPFDLTLLKRSVPFDSTKYSLSRIPIVRGRTKFSIFRSGSVISRASSSIIELEENLLKLQEYLTGFELELDLEYTITNIVAYSKLHLQPLNLLTLANLLPTSSYDPDASISEHERPGCNVIVHALTDCKPRKTILIFSSTAITLTGFRSIQDIRNQAYQFRNRLMDIIAQHPEVTK